MRRRVRGQAAFESALAMTAFLLMMFGLLDFARAYWAWQALGNVAREAARWAIVRGSESGLTKKQTEDQLEAYVAAQYGNALPPGWKSKVSWPQGSNDPGQPVKVELEAEFNAITPLLGLRKLKLEGASEMLILR
jgi:Flp pilus assembly protein TadG